MASGGRIVKLIPPPALAARLQMLKDRLLKNVLRMFLQGKGMYREVLVLELFESFGVRTSDISCPTAGKPTPPGEL